MDGLSPAAAITAPSKMNGWMDGQRDAIVFSEQMERYDRNNNLRLG